MRIKKVQLKNGYKRFYDLTIDLGDEPKRIIALIGPNGCGKSSILDGMLFHASSYGIQVGSNGVKNYEYHSMNRNHLYTGLSDNISIIFDTEHFKTSDSFDGERYRRLWKDRDRTIFSFRSPYRYNANLKVTQAKAISEIRLNQDGAGSTAAIDNRMEENYRRLNAFYYRYIHDRDCRPSEAKREIIGSLNQSIRRCLNLEISSIGNVDNDQGTLYFTKDDHPKEFEFDVLSSGEKEVVDILLDLYLRKDVYNETIFLLDEPDLHINTSIQKNLMLEINSLIGDNCQIWLTTHSIGFLRALQEELRDECQIIQFREDMNLASEPFILKPAEKNVTFWREVFEIALDDLAHLVSPKTIIFCEGKDKPGVDGKEQGLDADVFNNIFSENYPDTLFISSGGNTELDQRSEIAFSVLSKAIQDLEILVLKDKDISSGKITTQEQRKLYLESNPSNHRVLKRREIENYLFDKEVLLKYCAEKKLSFDEKSYDNFVSDVENDNLKDETGRMKNFCNVTVSINPETFKRNLSTYITRDMAIYQELEECIFNQS